MRTDCMQMVSAERTGDWILLLIGPFWDLVGFRIEI